MTGTAKWPMSVRLPGFPVTDTLIFRDFPDVLAGIQGSVRRFTPDSLRNGREDPWLIGYFLRNEPEFNFVENPGYRG